MTMTKIDIEGIELTSDSISVVRGWQQLENSDLEMEIEAIDDVCFHISNPDSNFTDKDRFEMVSSLLFLKRQIKTFRKENRNEER